MRVTATSPSAEVSIAAEGDLGHFWSLEQHADGGKRLARHDFLLVLYSDLRCRWNSCRVMRRQSERTVGLIRKQNKKKAMSHRMSRRRLRDAAKMRRK